MCLVVWEVRLVRKELDRAWDGGGVSAPSLEPERAERDLDNAGFILQNKSGAEWQLHSQVETTDATDMGWCILSTILD